MNIVYNTLVVEDLDCSLIKLKSGVYKIDGKIIELERETEVQISNTDDIRIGSSSRVHSHYINTRTEEEVSIDDYKREIKRLRNFRESDGTFNDIEDEIRYARYLREHSEVYKTITTFSDPLTLVKHPVRANTGNKFIRTLLSIDSISNGVCVYDREKAQKAIVSECFDELGFEYNEKASYGATENVKIWGCSTHSHLKYVVAFGQYIFNDKWGRATPVRGTLEYCNSVYEQDRKELREIILSKYNIHFNMVEGFDFKAHLKGLNNLLYSLRNISPMQKSRRLHNTLITNVNKLIKNTMTEISGGIVEEEDSND